MIGILALQGGYQAHQRVLDALNIANREVRLPHDLDDLRGLILPGGESTTMVRLLDAFELFEPLAAFANSKRPVLGTCAGAILMCRTINARSQKSLAWIPASIDRNAYGGQQESFKATQNLPVWSLSEVPALFIRAPRFTQLEEGVTVLSRLGQDITGIVYRQFTAVTYHPELGGDTRFHHAWHQRFVLEQEVAV